MSSSKVSLLFSFFFSLNIFIFYLISLLIYFKNLTSLSVSFWLVIHLCACSCQRSDREMGERIFLDFFFNPADGNWFSTITIDSLLVYTLSYTVVCTVPVAVPNCGIVSVYVSRVNKRNVSTLSFRGWRRWTQFCGEQVCGNEEGRRQSEQNVRLMCKKINQNWPTVCVGITIIIIVIFMLLSYSFICFFGFWFLWLLCLFFLPTWPGTHVTLWIM